MDAAPLIAMITLLLVELRDAPGLELALRMRLGRWVAVSLTLRKI